MTVCTNAYLFKFTRVVGSSTAEFKQDQTEQRKEKQNEKQQHQQQQ